MLIDSFILQEGGVSENPKRWYVKLNHYIDIDILKTAINKYADESKGDIDQLETSLDVTFNGIEYIENLDELNTFYY